MHDHDWDEDPRERARRRLEQRTGRASGENRSWADRVIAMVRRALDTLVEMVLAILTHFGLVRTLLMVVGVVAAVVLVMWGVRGCAVQEAQPVEQETPVDQPSESVAQEEPKPTPDTETLSALLPAETVDKLVQGAEANDDLAWIAANPDKLAVDGIEVQCKLLKLAADEPEAVSFVREFAESYPEDAAHTSDEAHAAEAQHENKVPRLYQWDKRWGYTVYSSTSFGLTGCCPTSFAMVYQGLTGKDDLSPYDMGVMAEQDGYMSQYNGTDASFLVFDAPAVGLTCQELALYADSLRWALDEGAVVICNVGPGDFTTDGHFFVITGLAEDGTLIINDPYSAERSEKTWDIDQVISQTMALYAFWAA